MPSLVGRSTAAPPLACDCGLSAPRERPESHASGVAASGPSCGYVPKRDERKG